MSNKLNILNKLPEHDEGASLGRFPSWLHRKIPKGGTLFKTQEILEKHGLNTVCEEAKCPNRLECYSKKTATFLVLGKECTRNCGFCDIDFSKTPKTPEADEPERIASSVRDLGLKHVVITMVARDDLPDGGASHLKSIIKHVRAQTSGCTIEVLTSDFSGNLDAVESVLEERPEIFNHNLETVRRLSPKIRHKATYDRSLSLLEYVKQRYPGILVKSGIMVGLGEEVEEVKETIHDVKNAGCDIMTIGHYLQASKKKLSVKSFVSPEQFQAYADYGLKLGLQIYSGPFVRSSYNAAEVYTASDSKSQEFLPRHPKF